MIYFSYNDFADCTENGKIDEVTKVEEKIAKYEVKNGVKVQSKKNIIIEILKQKIELKRFLSEFFNIFEIEDINNITYCNNIKSISDKEPDSNLICKITDKEIFIFIKVIEKIDNNITYKMFEHSLNIIKKWNIEEKAENRRYPIVIPITIYTGKETWKNNNFKRYNKINYIKYEDNRINFSYNMLNINNLKTNELKSMKSKVAEEIIKVKNKYLQINQ